MAASRRCRSALLLALAGAAHANGRAPGTSSIAIRQGHDADLLAGLTFGAAISHDGGATWHWMCEKAVGYGGLYDPDYAYSASGAVFATTFNGLVAMRDGCTFTATAAGTAFVSQVELGPTGQVFYAASDPADGNVHRSSDDGVTFPVSATPGQLNDYWTSLVVAPSDPQRVYLAGYRLLANQTRQLLLATSGDGGATWSPLATTAFTQSNGSVLTIAGVSPADPLTVYAHVTMELGNAGDGIYKSINGGGSFTKIFSAVDQGGLAFLARHDGSCVAGTPSSGSFVSPACDQTWNDLVNPPHIGCLVENAAGIVFACTQNYTGDGFGIMKSTDLAAWTGVLRYQDIAGPVACAAGTVQHDTCDAQQWCALAAQLGITSPACAPKVDGAPLTVDGPVDAPAADAPAVMPPAKKSGCCDAGDGGPTALVALALLVAMRPARRSSR